MATVMRIWRGSTTVEKGALYEQLLTATHFPSIAARKIPGFQRIELHKRAIEGGVEFITLMWFDSMDAVREYAGPDFERAAVSEQARALLTDPDPFVSHYEFVTAA